MMGAAMLTLQAPALGQTLQERASKSLIGHHPCVSTLCIPDVTHDQNSPGLLPPVIDEGLGAIQSNRTTYYTNILFVAGSEKRGNICAHPEF